MSHAKSRKLSAIATVAFILAAVLYLNRHGETRHYAALLVVLGGLAIAVWFRKERNSN